GRSVRRHVEITLERLATDPTGGGGAPRPAIGPGAAPAPLPAAQPAANGRRPPGWPVVTGVLLVVAVLAIGLGLLGGGSPADAANRAPTPDPPGATPAAPLAPEVPGTSTSPGSATERSAATAAPSRAAAGTTPAAASGTDERPSSGTV